MNIDCDLSIPSCFSGYENLVVEFNGEWVELNKINITLDIKERIRDLLNLNEICKGENLFLFTDLSNNGTLCVNKDEERVYWENTHPGIFLYSNREEEKKDEFVSFTRSEVSKSWNEKYISSKNKDNILNSNETHYILLKTNRKWKNSKLRDLWVCFPVSLNKEEREPIRILNDEYSIDTVKINLISEELERLPDSIGNLVNLEMLNLEENDLTELPESIGNLVKLKQIMIDDNLITQLPDSIGNLVNLEILSLENNDLTTLPESFENLVNLEVLNLSGNFFNQFPEEIENLQNLQSLGLSNNHLTQLPESIGNLVNLQFLYSNNNQLEQLPESIGNLTNLKKLSLNNNQLEQFPDLIGNLTNLEMLSLEKNDLTELPESIGNLINLRELSLNNNQLTQLPESIGNLGNLQYLYLVNNQLTTLPNSIGNLTNLKVIHLHNNQLTELPKPLIKNIIDNHIHIYPSFKVDYEVKYDDGAYKGDIILEFGSYRREGYGEMTYNDGREFKGEWRDDKREGKGIIVLPDGREFKGEWKNDEIIVSVKVFDLTGNLLARISIPKKFNFDNVKDELVKNEVINRRDRFDILINYRNNIQVKESKLSQQKVDIKDIKSLTLIRK